MDGLNSGCLSASHDIDTGEKARLHSKINQLFSQEFYCFCSTFDILFVFKGFPGFSSASC